MGRFSNFVLEKVDLRGLGWGTGDHQGIGSTVIAVLAMTEAPTRASLEEADRIGFTFLVHGQRGDSVWCLA